MERVLKLDVENDMEKICNDCQISKPLNRFYRDVRGPESTNAGYRQPCIKCTNKNRKDYNTNYRKDNPDKTKVYHRRAYVKDFNGRVASANIWRLKNWYHITLDDYNYLVELQNNRCAICNEPPKIDRRYGGVCRLHIDHYHGHHDNPKQACIECIRGLLCNNCNRRGLPWVEKDESLQSERIKIYLISRPLLERIHKGIMCTHSNLGIV